jgi:hypothetical protein
MSGLPKVNAGYEGISRGGAALRRESSGRGGFVEGQCGLQRVI